MSPMVQWQFRLPSEEKEKVEALAVQEDRTAAAILRRALRLYMAGALQEPEPAHRAGLWLLSLSDAVREKVVEIGEALKAVEERGDRGERYDDLPPPQQAQDTAANKSAAPGTGHTSKNTHGRKKRGWGLGKG